MNALSTIKLAQALAWSGDVGQYFISLFSIDSKIRAQFLQLLKCQLAMQQKPLMDDPKHTRQQLISCHAMMEALLPLFWCRITHHLPFHVDTVKDGAFWTTNGLRFERYLGKLKRLSRHGTKDRMATLAVNISAFESSSLWMLKEDRSLNLHYKVQQI